MTALIVKERLSMDKRVVIGRTAADMPSSKAGLTPGASYQVLDLLTALLVSSSNDAAVALAEAISGSEKEFVPLMNEKARAMGMKDTFFTTATGLTDKNQRQCTSAYDLTVLMRAASRQKDLDAMMEITETSFTGSDGKPIVVRAHNKMLWKMPKFVKGKTGWTNDSKHTFVGTNYSPTKSITFAMLSSQKPWTDIARLAMSGMALESRR